MGFFDRQRAKNDARIRAACAGRLEPAEKIVTAFLAVSRIPWWPFLLLFPVFFYFEYTGVERPWWAVGVACGLIVAFFVRHFFVVLTDRRLLVLHLRRMSSKHVESERGAPRAAATATYREGMINGRLRLDVAGHTYDLQVGRPFRDRALALVAEATAPEPSR